MTTQIMARTTLVVDTDTRERLRHFGLKGDTYEYIILKILKHYEKCPRVKREGI